MRKVVGCLILACVLFRTNTAATEAKPENAGTIPVIAIEDSIINPVVSEYILEAIDQAERNQAPALVIELDTPGGLLSSTRIIVKRMMNANVPILVYVAPSGSRAGSAGVFITLAAHVAAMAPSTNIGAAHPVEFGENPKKGRDSFQDWFRSIRKEERGKNPQPVQEEKDPMETKILNDTVAWVSGIAKERGRNVAWAVRAVKESISSGEGEALREGVIDFTAKDLNELLRKAEGKKVKLLSDREVTLHLSSSTPVRTEMTLRQKILNVLINPNIAYLLMVLGFYGLLFEITHPGVWFPGVAGLVCLILAFYAFHTLPTNYAGLSLIVLAITLFVMEIKVASYGLLSLAGIVCMLLGSLFLVNSTAAFMQISLRLIVPVVFSTAAIFSFLVGLAVKAHRQKSLAGIEGLIGATAEVRGGQKVQVGGELWDAIFMEPTQKGERVKIVSVEGMKLIVKKI